MYIIYHKLYDFKIKIEKNTNRFVIIKNNRYQVKIKINFKNSITTKK